MGAGAGEAAHAGLTAAPITDALQANLASTAVEAVVPEWQKVLLQITEPWFGVHQATEELLREINHPFPGWPQTLADLHRRATGDIHRYLAHSLGREGMDVLFGFYAKVARESSPDATRAEAVRLWLRYLSTAAGAADPGSPHWASIVDGLDDLDALLRDEPARGIAVSAQLKRLLTELDARGPGARTATNRATRIVAHALSETYRAWVAQADPADWYRAIAGEGAPPDPVARIGRARLADAARRLDQAADLGPVPVATLIAMPDNTEIVHGYLDAADAVDDGSPAGRSRKLSWLLRMVGHEGLAPVHELALRQVGRTSSELLAELDDGAREALVREVFGLLRDAGFHFTQTVQGLVGQLGRQILGIGDPALAAVMIDEFLRLDFDHPDFTGFTSEWGVKVNPAHLRQIRTYLSVIEADPAMARPLIAGLVVHLRLGGVFIADTDLFQRDVSSLLARPIGPVFLEVKHLLRLVPVYFNEIGAEGELRRASTRMDEMEGRRDVLCHFLRKQSHVECNPRLIEFAEEIGRYWVTGDPEPLRPFVPDSLLEELPGGDTPREELGRAIAGLADRAGGFAALFGPDLPDFGGPVEGVGEHAREKAELLVRVRNEIARKYRLGHADLVDRLTRFRRIDPHLVAALGGALAEGDDETALELVIAVLEELLRVVLTPGEVVAHEDIYRKRHIAAGIPSMYGSYREDRFEAMGLTFRAESLASALFQRVIDRAGEIGTDHEALAQVTRWLRLFQRGLRIDGFRARGLDHGISMLEEALDRGDVGPAQYLNIFQVLSRRIEDMIRARIIEAYEDPVRRIVGRMIERGVITAPEGSTASTAVLIESESVLRELIAGSFGLQALDGLVGRMLGALGVRARRETAPPPAQAADPAQHMVAIHGPDSRRGVLSLGNKGYMLRTLARLGFRVPEGFILTTELFGWVRSARPGDARRELLDAEVLRQLDLLERASGLRLGDPHRPLLLSVRSGAPISMPGMLETFLNVGINEDIAETLAQRPGLEWAAWDAYRRYLQTWGMSHGLERRLFDALMRDAKARHMVARKAGLDPAQMRRLALDYRDLLDVHGVPVVDDPRRQVLECVALVQDSWDSGRARAYRQELQIAEEWGTGVIVQRMVFGNLSQRSGTGVVLTRHPNRESPEPELYGDFVIQAQGDDVVSGLVATFPVSERQRRENGSADGASLEVAFPEHHAALREMAHVLVEVEGMNHQEIEFTFEGEERDRLYVLQTRDTVIAPAQRLAAFTPSPDLAASLLAVGVGVGGGALSGRVAQTAEDVTRLRDEDPHTPIILLRPDTVPDDIPVVMQADGLLTSLGGATSHAAVAAKRLGKTCVVGCRELEVGDPSWPSRIGERVLRTGEVISINGLDGSVYLGSHPVTVVRIGEGRRLGAPAGREIR